MLALDNIYHAIDEGSSTVLISLDLSAAFNTIDHTILLSRLQTSFGISGLTLAWFHSYLERRSQFFILVVPHRQLLCAVCTTGVRQGSVLGPMLFPYSSHPLHISSVHMASWSSSTLMTLSSMSPYLKTIMILRSPNSSFVSEPSIPDSAISG